MFLPLAKWPLWLKTVTLLTVGLMIMAALVMCWYIPGMETSSIESITIRNLRLERRMWLEDGCPQPPQPTNYFGVLPPRENYAYTNELVVDGRTYHGLFATEDTNLPGTFVVTTDNKILVIRKSGQPMLWKSREAFRRMMNEP